MKTITLTQGFVTLVDDQDFDWLIEYTWRYNDSGSMEYAVTGRDKGTEYMHIMIMQKHGLWLADHTVQHKDRDGLNNQIFNLKMVSKAVMYNNRKVRSDNKTGYKGVTEYKGKWRAAIKINKRQFQIGTYDTPEEAAKAYNRMSKAVFGEDGFQNQVDD